MELALGSSSLLYCRPFLLLRKDVETISLLLFPKGVEVSAQNDVVIRHYLFQGLQTLSEQNHLWSIFLSFGGEVGADQDIVIYDHHGRPFCTVEFVPEFFRHILLLHEDLFGGWFVFERRLFGQDKSVIRFILGHVIII